MIFTYNKEQVGDTLMVIVKDDKGAKSSFERRGRVARVFLEKTGETVAWNIFAVSELITLVGQGQVVLTDQDVSVLNSDLAKEGFGEGLKNDQTPKFVVGEITDAVPHPDSDHLKICQVRIASDQAVQIVAGAPNAAVGLKTIVALPGAMLPDGSLIFSGSLRGEDSYGMMCSPRELALPNAPQKRGIIELSVDTEVGQAFDAAQHWKC